MRLQSLVEHMAWADLLARQQLDAMAPDGPERVNAAAVLAHVAAAEHVWLSRLRGVQPRYAVWPKLGAREAAELSATTISELREFVGSASPSELSAEISYLNSSGQEFRNRAEDIIQHLALHGSYHRGQLAMLARQAGSSPVSTDYIVYLRSGNAAGPQA